MKRLLIFILALSLVLPVLCFPTAAAEENYAKEISGTKLIADSFGFSYLFSYFDGERYSGYPSKEDAWMTLTHEDGIGSLYFMFGKGYGPYTVTNEDTGETVTAGIHGFAHDFCDLTALFGEAPKTVTIRFISGSAQLYELDVYGPGPVPDSVQKWQLPVEGETDLVLFATHHDDDQLFFAGLLPYYYVERGYQVQVIYLTDHHNSTPFRIHEVLDSLWAVGIRNYPVLGPFPDFSGDPILEKGFETFRKLGHSREELTGWVVEQLRRFRPQVAVGHDFDGEYGHIQHKIYARLVADAVELSMDPAYHPESAEAYGVWDVPKTYIHLYKENPIVMNMDIPMENFGGMTPYQVAKELGFPAHKSQQRWAFFFRGYDTCASIPEHNPSYYGLYRTTVGVDENKDDMFENLICYAEQKRIAEEEARHQAEEAARLEEEARLKAEQEALRKAEEEEAARKEEEEARAASEAARLEQEAAAAIREESAFPLWVPAFARLAALITLVLLLLLRKRK